MVARGRDPETLPRTGPATAPTRRELLGLAIPALGTLAAEPLMGLLDTAIVGRLGAAPLAALGGATAVLNLFFALVVFLEYGTTLRLARRLGERDTARLVQEAVQMGWIAAGLGVLGTVAFALLPGPLLALVDMPAGARDDALLYLGIRSVGILPGLFLRVGNGVLRGLQDTRTPLAIVIAANVVNAILDLALVFGVEALGIPALGIRGAAWATVIATTGAALAFGWVVVRRLGATARTEAGPLPAGSLPARVRWTPDPRVVATLLGVSRDLLLRTLSLMAPLFLATRLAAGIGTPALAAHQVAWQLWMFMALVLDSVAIAGQATVGRLVGAGRADLARATGDRLCRWGLGIGVGFAVAFLLAGRALPRLFTTDLVVLATLGTIFPVVALMQIPNAILFALDGILIGAGDLRYIRNAMVGLGAGGLLVVGGAPRIDDSLVAIWLGLSVYMLGRLVAMLVRWRGSAWAPEATRGSGGPTGIGTRS